VIMDADLSHDPKYLRRMIQRQRESDCDIVIGSRYIKEGGVVGWSFF
jgi:dolichol-phosphate mannosyltransferase